MMVEKINNVFKIGAFPSTVLNGKWHISPQSGEKPSNKFSVIQRQGAET